MLSDFAQVYIYLGVCYLESSISFSGMLKLVLLKWCSCFKSRYRMGMKYTSAPYIIELQYWINLYIC